MDGLASGSRVTHSCSIRALGNTPQDEQMTPPNAPPPPELKDRHHGLFSSRLLFLPSLDLSKISARAPFYCTEREPWKNLLPAPCTKSAPRAWALRRAMHDFRGGRKKLGTGYNGTLGATPLVGVGLASRALCAAFRRADEKGLHRRWLPAASRTATSNGAMEAVRVELSLQCKRVA